ncbi:MAG: GntR family transcriptional regulator [Deltaproteobacteria bacterium]|nr:GntR family transcriptional regulator [Deltaproteobacteria bacterium]
MGLRQIDLQKKQTLREQIADAIRDAIIKGILRPEERVAEAEMANKFNISRTPIREAIRQLETEGFIKVQAHRGAYVAPITEKDVREFYEIKSLLEGYAAKLACARMSEEDIKKLDEINNRLEEAHKKNEWRLAFKLHNEFHDKFLRSCGNEKLYQILNALTQQFQRFRIALTMSGKIEGSIVQHKEIVNAFRKRNAEGVERLVKENATYGSETLISEILRREQV